MNLPCANSDCRVMLFETGDRGWDRDSCPSCGLVGEKDSRLEWAVRCVHPDMKDPLLLPQPTAAAAQTMATMVNGDSSAATAEILSRPEVGWSS